MGTVIGINLKQHIKRAACDLYKSLVHAIQAETENMIFQSANKWIKLMNSYNMGYVCWSLSNKPESASLLKASCKRQAGFTGNDLSGQGKWLVGKYKK